MIDVICPYCNSHNWQTYEYDGDSESVTAYVECMDCNKSFKVNYEPVSINKEVDE